jgi:hypothetical protein
VFDQRVRYQRVKPFEQCSDPDKLLKYHEKFEVIKGNIKAKHIKANLGKK